MVDQLHEYTFSDQQELSDSPLDLDSPALHDLRRRVEPNQVPIMIADDDKLFVEGLSALVEHWDEFTLVAKAYNYNEALKYACEFTPAIVLLGVRMEGRGSAQTIKDILTCNPGVKIMVLASSGEANEVLEALRAGAMGYGVRDEMSADRFRGVIWGVVSGEVILSGSIGTRVQEELLNPGSIAGDQSESNLINALTKREREILTLLMEGLSNAEIEKKLYIGSTTVKKSISRIINKLQVENRVQAAVYAARYMTQ